MRQNVAVVGQVPHFGPFPEKNQQKGYQKGWKTKFHQIRFQHVKRFLIIKKVLLSCFELKRGPG